MEVDTQTSVPALLPSAVPVPALLSESMGLVRHENEEVTLSELQARLFLREGEEWVNLGMGKLVFSLGKLSLRAYIAVVSLRSQTVLLDFAIAEAGKRRDRHVYVNAPNPKATNGSPHPRLHCFKFQTEKHAFQLEKRLMALANRDPVAALSRHFPGHKLNTPEQVQRARATYTAARLKQLQESAAAAGVGLSDLSDPFGLQWTPPARASSTKARVHPYATVSKDRKSRRPETNTDSTARALAEALAATSISPADKIERSDNVQTSIFGPLPPPPPPVKWGGFAEYGVRNSATGSKEITPDPTAEPPKVSQDFVAAFASQTIADTTGS
ncbi:hypothetical protein RhiJN_19041 [Ceratobasidium sp. AG-Ba]|nr:hypothetical protein RhiJN_19041 [Ceratobasidium sp. AG-Ba]